MALFTATYARGTFSLTLRHETDGIQLFDFNSGAKLGWEGDQDNGCEFKYEKDCNDVKFVIFTLYEIITREFCFRLEFYPHELDASKIMRKRKWDKHRNVQLDSPVDEFRRVLGKWSRKGPRSTKRSIIS